MTVDHYAGAAAGWAEGAALVYAPIARELVDASPHDLRDRTVLDMGAGTGVASAVLVEYGARVVGMDLSADMLSWRASRRPPAVVADVTALPLPAGAVDDTVCAFVLNHLVDPGAGLGELARVTRTGGAVLACVYSNAGFSPAREVLDEAARAEGWIPPDWYLQLKAESAPLLGSTKEMARVAAAAGLTDVRVDEREVDVGVNDPEQLVAYRLGQANFAPWLKTLGPRRTTEVTARLVARVRPVMAPYRPLVVFLSALA